MNAPRPIAYQTAAELRAQGDDVGHCPACDADCDEPNDGGPPLACPKCGWRGQYGEVRSYEWN